MKSSKNNIKLSIIVPCYKVEEYLPKCLDSLVNQTLEGVEAICINDGSKSSKIIRKKTAAKSSSLTKKMKAFGVAAWMESKKLMVSSSVSSIAMIT